MSLELPNLRNLNYSPVVNPLWEPSEVVLRTKRSGKNADVVSLETGEVTGCAVIRRVETVDDEHFVKVFSAGVAASFELSKSAQKAFQAVLESYQRTPMSGGFAEAVNLFWFDGGLDGTTLDMSEKTFQRGLKELLAKGFLAPKTPNVYWVNPHLFFRGDRVMFAREYRKSPNPEKKIVSDAVSPGKERHGQQRLIE